MARNEKNVIVMVSPDDPYNWRHTCAMSKEAVACYIPAGDFEVVSHSLVPLKLPELLPKLRISASL